MRLVVFLGATALSVVALPAWAEPLTVEPWDTKTSIEAEKSSARRAHLPSQLSLGRRYESGDGIARNADLAADYYAAAAGVSRKDGLPPLRALAGRGNVRAQMLLGRLLLSDASAEARAEGERFLAAAGDAGSAEADFILATRLATKADRGARQQAAARFVRAAKAQGKVGSFAQFLRVQLLRSQPRPEGPLVEGAPVVWDVRHDVGRDGMERRFAHWGLGERDYYKKEIAGPLAAARLFELSEAALSGDPVAEYVTRAELRRRCGENRKLDRLACTAMLDINNPFYDLSLYGGRPTLADLPRVMDIGKMFEVGFDGPRDPARARTLYEVALEQDRSKSAEAAWRLSQLLDKGIGGPADKKRARELLVQAADHGQPLAAYGLALEKMRSRDSDGLAFYLKAAADGGNADAAFYYAEFLSANRITSRHRPQDLLKYYSQAVAAGNRKAFYGMGMVYWNGWGVSVDEAKARAWWEKSARVGDPKAADHVAAMLLNNRDYAGAIPWLRRAAQGGYPGSQAKLQEVLAAGYRERNLAGFLMGVFDFVGDVGEGMARAYQAEYERQQEEIRFSMMVNAALAANGSSSGSSASSSGAGSSSSSGDPGGSEGAGGSASGSGSAGSDSGGESSGGGSSGGGIVSSTDAESQVQSIANREMQQQQASQQYEAQQAAARAQYDQSLQSSETASSSASGGGSGEGSSGAIIVEDKSAEYAAQAKAEAERAAKAQADYAAWQEKEAARKRQVEEEQRPAPKKEAVDTCTRRETRMIMDPSVGHQVATSVCLDASKVSPQ